MKQRMSLFVLAVLVLAAAAPAQAQILSLTKMFTLNGESQLDEFSGSVDGVGDINGDGFDDFLVGSPGHSKSLPDNDKEDDARVGKAYLFLGGSQLSATPALTFEGSAQNQDFACAVAGLGDVNADGIDDYIIGSDYLYLSFSVVTAVLAHPGTAQIYFGGNVSNPETMLLQPGFGRQKDRFGISVAGRLDYNGDGYNDILVSAAGVPEFPNMQRPCTPGSENLCKFRVFMPERVFLYFGGPELDDQADLTFALYDTVFVPSGESFNPTETWYGETVAPLGDLNNDGFDDFGVNQPGTGNVYVYLGSDGSATDPALVLSGEKVTDAFGSSLSAAGDLNNDGFDDFMVGAEAADHNGIDSGTVYVYYGGAVLDGDPDLMLYGEGESDRFGTEIVLAGDLNDDGQKDIAISARNADGASKAHPTHWSGKVYVYYGGTSFDGTPDPVVSSWLDYERFGLTLAAGGDLNNDGFDDLLVGAPEKKLERDDGYRGSLYVFGNPLLTPVSQITLEALAQGENVLLQWQMVSDEIPSGFLVQRVENGQRRVIHEGLLPGTTTSFVDDDVSPGRSYEYWIDVVERAGNVKSFGPAFASVPLGNRFTVGLPHPNPMPASGMQVEYRGQARQAGIYDLQGRLVQSLDVSPSPAGGVLSWDGASRTGGPAADGIYFLRVLGSGNEVVTKRLIKLPSD